MKNKYYNDAIIGNKKMIASFSSNGEMLRLIYPSPDYKQFIDKFLTGVKVNDSALIYLHEDINNEYDQFYTEETNILNTKIKNTYFNLSIMQTDFVCIDKNVLVKKYTFTNENTIDLDVNFLIYSKLLSNTNNMVGTRIEENVFMQYTHDYTFNIFSKMPMLGYRLHESDEEIKSGILQDKDYIGIGNDSAVSYDIGTLKPGDSKEIEIFIYINDNSEIFQFDDILKEIEKIKKIDTKKEENSVEKYWKNFIKEHDGLKVISNKDTWRKKVLNYDKVKNIYVRSILLFSLLSNKETGGISAAIEIDENQTLCGRYSYCWPRDAVFITKALDLLKMKEQTEKFYLNFSKKTQSKNGMWEQRFYTDGRLAPCWGYQIDETASIVYGIYEHYKIFKNKQFLEDTYDMCKRAIKALENYCNVSASKIERFKTHESYDLWEMHEGVSLYSLSVIYAAFNAMAKIEKILDENANIKYLEDSSKKLKQYSLENFINNDNSLKRNNKDNICDISLLGTVVPFRMLDANQKEVENTIERINWTLRTYSGGYIRFENDSYLGGNYPWPIATLWMALYNLQKDKKENALELINFVTNTGTEHGFLAEQVDNDTMQAKWVIGLGWSHAMYIIALSQLSD